MSHHGFRVGEAKDWDGVARLGLDIGDLREGLGGVQISCVWASRRSGGARCRWQPAMIPLRHRLGKEFHHRGPGAVMRPTYPASWFEGLAPLTPAAAASAEHEVLPSGSAICPEYRGRRGARRPQASSRPN